MGLILRWIEANLYCIVTSYISIYEAIALGPKLN